MTFRAKAIVVNLFHCSFKNQNQISLHSKVQMSIWFEQKSGNRQFTQGYNENENLQMKIS